MLDLNQDEEEIWSNIKNSKRHSIRKAIREGVAVKMETSESNLGNTYEILLQVYNRIKLPCPNMDFFKNCKAHFQNDPRFLVFTANWEDKTIAFRYVLAYKKVLYITYAGGLEEYYSKNANDLLNWELFLWGKENGYTVYDLQGQEVQMQIMELGPINYDLEESCTIQVDIKKYINLCFFTLLK